ncbi:hypothetical protein [Desulfopila inferna]|nr:hypothetical protein [Desulfopila inferna]MBM9604053.1 hypothetical protein [Desulfopila inferna]
MIFLLLMFQVFVSGMVANTETTQEHGGRATPLLELTALKAVERRKCEEM